MLNKKDLFHSFAFLRVLASSRWLLVFLASVGLAFAAVIEIIKDVPSIFVYPTDGFLPFNIHRASQTIVSLYLRGTTFSEPKGVASALLKSDQDPHSPQNDVVVTVIGVNSGAGEIIYNVGLKDLRRFGSLGRADKQFMAPTGVAIDPDGEVAVAATGNNPTALRKHAVIRIT